MGRQVEIVPGNHVVVRVAGVIVLVAHRERGPVTGDSVVMRAAEALARLVTEAYERAPDGPGRLVAREVTRWLMKEAEQISPGVPLDLGILSQADTGGVAILLHGAVTAMLAGSRGVEYYHGADAAFTVDRVAEPPDRAAAIFIDDDRGPVTELPERGIGSLVEGVLPASGAIVWYAADRARARDRVPPNEGAHWIEEPPPVAEQGSPPPEVGEHQGVPNRVVDPRMPPPLPAQAVPQSGPQPRYEEPRYGPLSDPPQGQPVGTNPSPDPDPALERRMEATTRATALTVKVVGFKCARAHPSDPRSAFCTVCGMPVDQTQPPSEVVRPPLGVLVLDDGMTFMLATDAVLGRDPENSEAARRGLMPIKLEDTSGGMSRAHAEIRLVNWDVTLVDTGSTNGTHARQPGYQDWIRLQANQPIILMQGSEIMLGNRVLRLDPAAPPPFG